jgi:hypothetical protein
MSRDTRVQLVAVLLAMFALAGAGVLAVNISASQGRHKLVYTTAAAQGQPPQVALGIAMGAFRGLFVNVLWIRANEMKEEGRYYEAVDLARAITELQPRFPHVWVFHAWNLAYNISVNTQTNRERWQWVNAGVDLLRTRGIPANPNDMYIHKELSWLFLHKIGGYSDDANLYYKRQLAAEWTYVLGPPPPPDPKDRSLEGAKKKYIDWLRPVANAPETLEAATKDAGVRALVERVRAELGVEPDWKLVHNYTTMTYVLKSGLVSEYEKQFDDKRKKLAALMRDPALGDAWPLLMAHLRKRLLLDRYNMDPERMIRYTERFGPLDWRHFGSHALYWAQAGVEAGMERVGEQNRSDFDFVNSGRMVVQALQELWRTGDVYFDFLGFVRNPDDEHVFYRASPSVHFIDTYGDYLNQHIAEITKDPEVSALNKFENPKKRAFTLYASGYENFRKDAIRFLYRRGEIERANKMKDDLMVWPYHNINDPDRAYLFSLPLSEFVEKELENELSRPSVAREEIVGALQSAFINGLLGGDTAQFDTQMKYAASVHKYFYSRQVARTQLDPTTARMGMVDRNFAVVAGSEFAALAMVIDLDSAETMYDAAPNDLRLWAYDLLVDRYKTGLDELASKAKADGRQLKGFGERFREPTGLAEHRALVEKMQKERSQTPVGIEAK